MPPIVGPRSEQGSTLSVPLGVRSFEEGELEGDGPTEEVAAQARLCRADPVQLRTQEIDEAAKIRIVVQCDPLGVHKVVRQRLRRAVRIMSKSDLSGSALTGAITDALGGSPSEAA